MVFPPALFSSPIRIAFALSGSLWFHVNFILPFFDSCEECYGHFHWHCIESMTLGRMVISPILVLPISAHGRSSFFLASFYSSLFKGLNFSLQGLSPPWLTLFLDIFSFFEAIVNGVVSMISLSWCLLLVYRKVICYRFLILCWNCRWLL